MFSSIKDFFDEHNIVRHIGIVLAISIFGVGFLLLIYFMNNRTIIDACNGSFGAFAILFGIGSMQIIINYGTFDSLCYSFANMFATWQKGGQKKYVDLYVYKEIHAPARKKRKFYFVDWYIASGVLLVVAIILEIVYHVVVE